MSPLERERHACAQSMEARKESQEMIRNEIENDGNKYENGLRKKAFNRV